MTDAAHLNGYDLAVFAAYMLLTVGVGFWAARGMRSLGRPAMPASTPCPSRRAAAT